MPEHRAVLVKGDRVTEGKRDLERPTDGRVGKGAEILNWVSEEMEAVSRATGGFPEIWSLVENHTDANVLVLVIRSQLCKISAQDS